MNEDFYIENQETWYDHVYFEPPYDPDAYLPYDIDEDFDNLNDLQSIENYGNYRYRPNDSASPIYNALVSSYDVNG